MINDTPFMFAENNGFLEFRIFCLMSKTTSWKRSPRSNTTDCRELPLMIHRPPHCSSIRCLMDNTIGLNQREPNENHQRKSEEQNLGLLNKLQEKQTKLSKTQQNQTDAIFATLSILMELTIMSKGLSESMSLDQWFKATFRYWPANPKEPILIDIGKASQLLEYVQEVSIFRGHPVCGFNVEKINQDKVAALFKMREVDNPLGGQFAPYISFALTNGQSYIIDTTGLMEKEWQQRQLIAAAAAQPPPPPIQQAPISPVKIFLMCTSLFVTTNFTQPVCHCYFSPSLKDEAKEIMSKFKWGDEFMRLNEELLDAYSACRTSAEILSAQNMYIEKAKQEERERKNRPVIFRNTYVDQKIENSRLWGVEAAFTLNELCNGAQRTILLKMSHRHV
uniref:16S/18S rRNA aminocarboxypropyltransferase Tsr3 C-terminal domain-containing protein n=1 Tax=Romanomermis culicivorax TaxID=13658 RepID=A0A915ID19_ROMCU